MNRRVACTLVGLLVAASPALAQEQKQGQEQVAAPQGAKLLLEAIGQGVQIYTCERTPDGYRWTFSAPDAALFDADGRQIGTHFAGPTWQLDDGGKITGQVIGHAAASVPHAVDWLLLRVTSHEGGGALRDVGLVRRIETRGGAAPAAGCDAAHAAEKARMRYAARYLFYAERQ